MAMATAMARTSELPALRACGSGGLRPMRRGAGLGGLLGDERGAVTIEFTTLVPFFVFLLVFFADASIIYLTHTEMYNAARDIARRMSTEELGTESEVLDYAAAQVFLGDRTYTVDTDFGGNMRVSIAIGLGDAAISGYFFSPILGRTLTASATVRREPMI